MYKFIAMRQWRTYVFWSDKTYLFQRIDNKKAKLEMFISQFEMDNIQWIKHDGDLYQENKSDKCSKYLYMYHSHSTDNTSIKL